MPGNPGKQKGKSPKALVTSLLEHETFSWWKVGPSAQAPAGFRASLRHLFWAP